MTRRQNGQISRPRFTAALAVVVALLAVGLPASTTSANLSNAKSVTSSTTPVGDWCSVPGSSQFKNVYRLNDFTRIDAPETATTTSSVRMIVVPVVNNGEFAPVGGAETVPSAAAGQLGIRLWGCSDLSAVTSSLKVSAWRGNYTAQQSFVWDTAPSSGSFAAARLNTSGTINTGATGSLTKPGTELRDLHRAKSNQGGISAGGSHGVTMRYSWLLSNGRDKTVSRHQALPACSTFSCAVTSTTGGDGVGVLSKAFSSNEASLPDGAVSGNSATFLAQKYYASSGVWPSTTTLDRYQCRSRTRTIWFEIFGYPIYGPWTSYSAPVDSASPCPPESDTLDYDQKTIAGSTTKNAPAALPTRLSSAAGMTQDALLRDATGDYIQWVVLEWWGGKATVPADLEVEVFVK